MEPVRKFDVTLEISRNPGEEQNTEPVKSLVSKVRTEWKEVNLEAKMLAGGHINTIVKVWTKDGGDDDAVIVRINSPNSKIRENPATMVTVMRVAEAGGLGAPVLGEFNNGLIYKYTPGDMMIPDLYPQDAKMQKLIAEMLAQFHCLNPDKLLPPEEAATLPREPRVFKDIHHFLDLLPKDFSTLTWHESKLTFTREDFVKELSWIEQELEKCDDEVVFCHNDCWWPNQIYNRETGKVTFIDLDLAHYNYVSRELACYLYFGQLEFIPNTICRWHMFRESEKRYIIKCYLQKRRQLETGTGSDTGNDAAEEIPEGDIDRILRLTTPMELVMALDRISVCMFINTEKYPVNYIWATNVEWDTYNSMKKEYLILRSLDPVYQN